MVRTRGRRGAVGRRVRVVHAHPLGGAHVRVEGVHLVGGRFADAVVVRVLVATVDEHGAVAEARRRVADTRRGDVAASDPAVPLAGGLVEHPGLLERDELVVVVAATEERHGLVQLRGVADLLRGQLHRGIVRERQRAQALAQLQRVRRRVVQEHRRAVGQRAAARLAERLRQRPDVHRGRARVLRLGRVVAHLVPVVAAEDEHRLGAVVAEAVRRHHGGRVRAPRAAAVAGHRAPRTVVGRVAHLDVVGVHRREVRLAPLRLAADHPEGVDGARRARARGHGAARVRERGQLLGGVGRLHLEPRRRVGRGERPLEVLQTAHVQQERVVRERRVRLRLPAAEHDRVHRREERGRGAPPRLGLRGVVQRGGLGADRDAGAAGDHLQHRLQRVGGGLCGLLWGGLVRLEAAEHGRDRVGARVAERGRAEHRERVILDLGRLGHGRGAVREVQRDGDKRRERQEFGRDHAVRWGGKGGRKYKGSSAREKKKVVSEEVRPRVWVGCVRGSRRRPAPSQRNTRRRKGPRWVREGRTSWRRGAPQALMYFRPPRRRSWRGGREVTLCIGLHAPIFFAARPAAPRAAEPHDAARRSAARARRDSRRRV